MHKLCGLVNKNRDCTLYKLHIYISHISHIFSYNTLYTCTCVVTLCITHAYAVSTEAQGNYTPACNWYSNYKIIVSLILCVYSV